MNEICRYCNKKIADGEETNTTAYWYTAHSTAGDGKYLCHKNCKKEGEAKEAYACQTIDADCNDCLFFKRDKMFKAGEKLPDGKFVLGGVVWTGHCMKFDKPTIAEPKMATNHPCFEHRKKNDPLFKDL